MPENENRLSLNCPSTMGAASLPLIGEKLGTRRCRTIGPAHLLLVTTKVIGTTAVVGLPETGASTTCRRGIVCRKDPASTHIARFSRTTVRFAESAMPLSGIAGDSALLR